MPIFVILLLVAAPQATLTTLVSPLRLDLFHQGLQIAPPPHKHDPALPPAQSTEHTTHPHHTHSHSSQQHLPDPGNPPHTHL